MKVDALLISRLRHLVELSSASEIPIKSMLRGSLLARATVGIQTPLRLGVVLLLLASSAEILVYLSGSTISGFYPALATRDATRFFTLIGTAAILYILSSLMGVLRSWAQGCLAVLLRRNLTAALHQRYVSKNNLYNIAMKASCPKEYMTQNACFREPTQNFDMDGNSEYSRLLMNDGMREDQSPPLDNPDQTIVQDAGKFGEQASELLVKFITIPILILYYTREVYNITQTIVAPILIYIFFLVSWSLCLFAMNVVVPAVFEKECREGDFRFNHVHARTEAEAIAMMHCESGERRRLDSLMASLVNATFVVLEKTVPLDYCITLTGFFGALISYLVISIPVFDGTFDGKTEAEITGLVSKNLFVCLYLIYQFNTLTKLSRTFSELSGYTTRLALLLESCDSLEKNSLKGCSTLATSSDNPSLHPSTNLLLQVHMQPPASPVSFSVNEGQHTLIQGPSGCGKSSVFRFLSGIWHQLPGDTVLFHSQLLSPVNTELHPSNIIFVPQQGHIVPITTCEQTLEGSRFLPLLTQIAYPSHPSEIKLEEREVESLLLRVGLSHLISRCSATSSDVDFVGRLSGGEKQRLQIARILFWKPRLVFLDESLGALDAEMEVQLYKEVMDSGITVIAISHSESGHVQNLFNQHIKMIGN